MISITDRKVVKAVFRVARIESSSDFIFTVYEIARRLENPMQALLEPIIAIEEKNWRDMSVENIFFVTDYLDRLEYADVVDAKYAYETILDYLLEDEVINDIYPMDMKDHIGWKIFKELSEKRTYCIRVMNVQQAKGQL